MTIAVVIKQILVMFLELGAVGAIVKPFNPLTLAAEIAVTLSLELM